MNEIELLFTEILNCQRHQLYLNKDISIDNYNIHRLQDALSRMAKGEPIQYILEKVDFMGVGLKVNSHVFIPRPETEILVETVIKNVSSFARLPVCPLNILDIGTGSGCIAISLAKFSSNVAITATDISPQVLEVARYNALSNSVDDKIRFICSDLFESSELQVNNYDVIVSNPPYIPTTQIKNLLLKIKYEPRTALDGGKDGLDFYKKIIFNAGRYLKERGILIMEIGFGQCRGIKNLFKTSNRLEIIDIIKDYNNIDRVVVAQLQ